MTRNACLSTPVDRDATSALRQPVAPVFISVAEVALGTTAAQSTSISRSGVLRRLRTALLDRRITWRTQPAHRGDYLESAAMAREMHRL